MSLDVFIRELNRYSNNYCALLDESIRQKNNSKSKLDLYIGILNNPAILIDLPVESKKHTRNESGKILDRYTSKEIVELNFKDKYIKYSSNYPYNPKDSIIEIKKDIQDINNFRLIKYELETFENISKKDKDIFEWSNTNISREKDNSILPDYYLRKTLYLGKDTIEEMYLDYIKIGKIDSLEELYKKIKRV
jgi:hypothetical protein